MALAAGGVNNVDSREPEFVGVMRATFESVVDAYAWRFGESNSRLVVGSLALVLLVLVTALTAFYAFREVAAIGVKCIKLVVLIIACCFLGSLVLPTYTHVFPTEAARTGAENLARQAATQAAEQAKNVSGWAIKRWLLALA